MYRSWLLTAICAACLPALADEGMWTFDNFPRDAVQARYSTGIGQGWLDRARRSTVRLEGGCTGSFVSAEGLVLTNHHCVADCLSRLSTPARDLQGNGFLAATRAAEERCEAEQLSVLTRLEDVTAAVTARVGEGIGPAANQRRKAVLTALEQDCEQGYRQKADPHACEAVTLYGGGQYFLYHYKRYEDVRLVFAPEAEIGFFGGDVDNFEFPRWNLDFALLRAYERGAPATAADFLRWRRAGAAAGEPVFVAGHPGSTQRLDTIAELRFERDRVINRWLLRASELRGRYLQYAAGGAEPARIVQKQLFYLENSLKVRRNQLDVLLDENFLAGKQKDEQALRTAVAASPGLGSYAGAWADIEGALDAYRSFFDRHSLIEQGSGFQGDLAGYARLLVRAAGERARPNEERQREFTEAALPLLRARLLASQPVYRDLEVLRLAFSLEKMVEYLGVDDPTVRAALNRESPRSVATRLVAQTRLADPRFRAQLWDGGQAAIEKSGDPLIALALRVEPDALKLRQRYEDEVESVILGARERIARARFAVKGRSVYPDATFTLRLSYGAVEGWREGDRDVEPFTTVEGLYARATGDAPFRLPPRWAGAQERVNLDTRFNFATNNDITGGNSGSPVLDGRGRLVGLIFDGNIHSIGGDYGFDPALNRAVAVHPAAMVLALSEVYGAGGLLRELVIE
jgi:hypothetical protein